MIPNILTSNKWASEPGEVSSDALGFKKFLWMQDGFLRFQSKITSWSSDSIVTHYSMFDSEVLWVRWQYSKTGYVSLTATPQAGLLFPFTFSVTHCLLISSLYQFVKQSTQWIFCVCFTQLKKKDSQDFKRGQKKLAFNEQATKWLTQKPTIFKWWVCQ